MATGESLACTGTSALLGGAAWASLPRHYRWHGLVCKRKLCWI